VALTAGTAAPAAGARAAKAGWKRLLEASVPISANGNAKNGHSNGHANGQANGHSNGHAAQNGNGHIRGRAKRTSQAVPRLRRGAALFANSFRLVVLGGLRSWRRDLRFNAPAMQTMALLLVMCGFLALIAAAIAPAAARAESDASVVRVYLADGTTQDQVTALQSRLQADPRVASVRYISSDEALREASGRPGLDSLAGLSDTNPFPASLDVKDKLVTEVSAVAQLARGDPAADPTYPTSYDPSLYGRLKKLAIGVGVVGGALVLLLAFIAYAVAANAMRATAAARREELKTLRLLGARPWMLRDPFVIEGLMTGAVAGAVAGAVVAGVWVLAAQFASTTFIDLLPGVGLTAVREIVAIVIVTGMILGLLTSLLSFRRVRA
jgi:cell division transport system permease protein